MPSFRELPTRARTTIEGATKYAEPPLITEVYVVDLNPGNLVLIGTFIYVYSDCIGDNEYELELVGQWERGGGEGRDEGDEGGESVESEGEVGRVIEIPVDPGVGGDDTIGLNLPYHAGQPGQDRFIGGFEEDGRIMDGSEAEGGGGDGGEGEGSSMEGEDSEVEEGPLDTLLLDLGEDFIRWSGDDYLETLNNETIQGFIGHKRIVLPGELEVGFLHGEADIDGMLGVTKVVSDCLLCACICFGAKVHGSIYPRLRRQHGFCMFGFVQLGGFPAWADDVFS
jgi:hypothetical protein